MINHTRLNSVALARLIIKNKICFAGNHRLRIYGTLTCVSGKRMKAINRVFFTDELDAANNGFRPCAHCMHKQYITWKLRKKQVE